LTSGGIIAAYVISLLVSKPLGIDPASLTALHDLAILAFGAVVGSTVAVNGYRAPLAAAHARLDSTNARLNALGTIVADGDPHTATAVREILIDNPDHSATGSPG
jgi:hypothetical protein